ncbi:MAG TPA: glycosyltransferase, partial [Myxococcota bacterium]|nr:glycosyltransferase [Myxococcota bacterium]
MKHVLVISYHFPPAGGVPVRRALRTVRNLPAYGWRCSVLSADRPYDPFHPEDPEGLLHLPPIVRLLRPPARAGLERALVAGFAVLQRARALLPSAPALKTTGPPGGSLRRLLYDSVAFPDPKRPWVRGAVAEASRAAREDPYDAVLALGYPWSAFLVGSALRRALSVPLVLDFRDAWTENPRGLWTSARHAALERRLVREADSVILATDGIRDGLRRRNPELA